MYRMLLLVTICLPAGPYVCSRYTWANTSPAARRLVDPLAA
jgi:hypothetical protein